MDKRKLTHRFWASFRFFIGFGSTAFNLRQRVLCLSNLHGRFRFSCCPDSGSQLLETLQPCRQWPRAPLPAMLPALVGAKRLPSLFFYAVMSLLPNVQ